MSPLMLSSTLLDNFSRVTLSFRVADRFEIANTIALLVEAARGVGGTDQPPMLVVDGGVENSNGGVDDSNG